MKPNAILIHPQDNVAIVLEPVQKGAEIRIRNRDVIIAQSEIMRSHKVLLTDLAQGDPVVKYGEVIGTATQPLKMGEWVHVHNLTINEA